MPETTDAIWITILVESSILLLFCVYIVWWFAAKDRTPFYAYIVTVIGWFLGWIFVFLIPLDIYFVRHTPSRIT